MALRIGFSSRIREAATTARLPDAYIIIQSKTTARRILRPAPFSGPCISEGSFDGILSMFHKIVRILAFSLGVVFLVGIWGVAIEPRLIDEVHYDVEIPHLPPEWERARIAFICDLQVGMWFGNEDTSRRIVERIIAARPAAVLIGGDFIYHPTEDDPLPEALEEFAEEDGARTVRDLVDRTTDIVLPLVQAGLPVYAVFGNHDYAMETQESLKLPWVAEILESSLEAKGVRVLKNEAVALKRSGDAPTNPDHPLYIVGVGPYYPHEADVRKAFSGLPETAPRIILMHNPQPYENIPAGQAPLTLAGHTHGGQIRIPFLPSWSWLSIVKGREVHADGWIKDFGHENNRLYVSKGIGFSIVPIRINCRPELAFFTLSGRGE